MWRSGELRPLVREYRAGIAPHLIMTGGAAHNNFIEAHSMKLYAIAQGVPAGVPALPGGHPVAHGQHRHPRPAQVAHRRSCASQTPERPPRLA